MATVHSPLAAIQGQALGTTTRVAATQGPKSSSACRVLKSIARLSPSQHSKKQKGAEAVPCIQTTDAIALTGEIAAATWLKRNQPWTPKPALHAVACTYTGTKIKLSMHRLRMCRNGTRKQVVSNAMLKPTVTAKPAAPKQTSTELTRLPVRDAFQSMAVIHRTELKLLRKFQQN